MCQKNEFSKRTGYGTLSLIIWHPVAKEEISFFPEAVKTELGYLLFRLQLGELMGMPKSRPMSSVMRGVHELRVRGKDGIFRVFYYLKSKHGILVFYAFQKKTQKTDSVDLNTGRMRLKEMLGDLDDKS